jgi:two-component system sensor histidine kinase KdpD
VRVVLSLGAVAVTTGVLVATDADLTFAAVILLLVVAGASVLGYAAGLTTAVASVAALNYYFTPPTHSFRMDQPDDILALVAFVTVALLVGATIARLNELRARAEVHAREASLRVTLTHELRRGVAVEIVLRRLAAELQAMFDLRSCTVALRDGDAPRPSPGNDDLVVESPPLVVRLAFGRPLAGDDLAVIRGLADAVAAGIELERLDAEAREQRVRNELDQSRAALLTAITHDLRTPLATIKAASGALLASTSRLDETDRRELLHDTWTEATRLERLVDKVLEMGRIRSDSVRPERVAIAPIDLVQAATSRRGRTVVGRAQDLALDLDADLPAVDVDVLLMDHVLTNLLENATVHGSSDAPIEIRGSSHDGVVRMAVIDHGPGIPPADRELVFDEFVRRGAPTDGEGTGLGLTIVRALVEAHGGAVWCEETPGGGATFVVELPVAEEGCAP